MNKYIEKSLITRGLKRMSIMCSIKADGQEDAQKIKDQIEGLFSKAPKDELSKPHNCACNTFGRWVHVEIRSCEEIMMLEMSLGDKYEPCGGWCHLRKSLAC